ncbi:hypothetical protein ACWHLZ_14730 [Streptomyces chartreusis]|uniref:hypothetical protein n=1 Tax=Streptomyces TaxID=1883 RepID=UPI00340157BB|nr:hypothetical protein OG938_27370 [Streptomyces chartreusis]WTA27619.1 hypothetical protein OIA45_17060 [Streptomyces chartreusis]
MGSLRVALCTIAALGAVAVTPAAHATDGGVSLSPSSPQPGGDITLRVSGCAQRTATAVSKAFVADARLTVAGDGELVGESRVRSTARAGSYGVQVACGDTSRTGAVTVAAKAAGHSVRHGPQPASSASPTAPVRAGGGGTSRLAMVDAREEGPGTAHTVTGLILAGVAATAVALRSARRGRRPR